MELGCVIMACGQGTRFAAAGGAGDKLLADVAGVPLIARTVASVPVDAFERVLCVRDARVARAVAAAGLATKTVNIAQDAPLRSEVVRCGLAAGCDRWEGCLFLPGDQPLVCMSSFYRLSEAFADDPTRAYRLSWEGAAGSPVLFPRSCFEGLMALSGTRGGGALLAHGAVSTSLIAARSACELLDVDTPADLERVVRCMRERGGADAGVPVRDTR